MGVVYCMEEMVITSAEWTPSRNMLYIKCPCGQTILHPANKWRVACSCGRTDRLDKIRDRYVAVVSVKK